MCIRDRLILSHKKARATRSWDRVNEALEKDEIIKGYIKCRTKGGKMCIRDSTYSMCRLKDSYSFNPVPDSVPAEMILGGQGNLWAESVPTFRLSLIHIYLL